MGSVVLLRIPPRTKVLNWHAQSPVSHSLASARKALTDVSEFLTFPSTKSTSKKSKPPGSARVLTSAQSLAIMKEKELKKREEEEAIRYRGKGSVRKRKHYGKLRKKKRPKNVNLKQLNNRRRQKKRQLRLKSDASKES